ncbi:MAG: AAA family ATPase [bacterium]
MTQDEALAVLQTGANVFLTGEPGSGKTHTVNAYVAWLRGRGVEPAITASTGIAATHIGGYTIHSWSGVGIRQNLSVYDLDAISQNKGVVTRVGGAHVLIIDEVSMLSSGVLSMVEAICREVRRNTRPFGGLQVVFVGDFFQLPPVKNRKDQESTGFGGGRGQRDEQELLFDTVDGQDERGEEGGDFAFGSAGWSRAKPLVCYLSEQHRQEDSDFLGLLSAIRRDAVDDDHKNLLRKRYAPKPKKGVTQLYSHNMDVDRINVGELGKLSEETKTFTMKSHGPEKLVAGLKRGCLSPEVLALKVGARVMFTKNDHVTHKFVNGTQGIVVGFMKDTGVPMVQNKDGKVLFADPVEWLLQEGGRVLASLEQVPLRLAWAMTVHKSQGMSLDEAHMDLSGAFEYGQGYVALSRVRTLGGLSLAGLNERALQVHPEVLSKDAAFRTQSEEVQEAFAALSRTERTNMEDNFIRAMGGKTKKEKQIEEDELE